MAKTGVRISRKDIKNAVNAWTEVVGQRAPDKVESFPEKAQEALNAARTITTLKSVHDILFRTAQKLTGGQDGPFGACAILERPLPRSCQALSVTPRKKKSVRRPSGDATTLRGSYDAATSGAAPLPPPAEDQESPPVQEEVPEEAIPWDENTSGGWDTDVAEINAP